MRRVTDRKSRSAKLLAMLLLSFVPFSASSEKSGAFRLELRNSYMGKPYDSLRSMLMSSGWEPEPVHGQYPDFPEIHCSLSGNCIGYWRKNMKELFIGVDVRQEPFVAESLQSEQEYKKENAN